MMKFDKSKVCVAGLHEVKEGVCGWFSDSVDDLDYKVTRNSVTRTSDGCLAKMKGQRDCLYVDELNTVWRFFYPAPEKQYRPFETIEEAEVMKGKWIRSKFYAEFFMVVTSFSVDFLSGMLLINGHTPESLCNEFVIDETGEPVGVEE